MKNIKVLLLSGGKGNRFSNHFIPKQFVEINHKPIMVYALENIQRAPEIDSVVIVINENYKQLCEDILKTYKIEKFEAFIEGGTTRQESTFKGLCYLKDTDYVVVQNAVCPLSRPTLFSSVIAKSTNTNESATAFIEVVDTVVKKSQNKLSQYFDRSQLVKIQSPQVFPYQLIKECHERAVNDGILNITNDVHLIDHYGYPVHLVRGDFENIKITTMVDWFVANEILNNKSKPSSFP